MSGMFPQDLSITLYDPLAELLGAGDGHFSYTFDDAAKLSGHACPTVAGAFLMTLHALRELYGDATPQRGDIAITIHDAQDQGVTGPISQVFTLLTGAAADNGFHGLGGRFARSGLMKFMPGTHGPAPFVFERRDSGVRVGVNYDPSSIPADPAMGSNLQLLMQGSGDQAVQQAFTAAWRDRVWAILQDGGNTTVSVLPIDR
ncbi:MAG: hypothetical protein GY753_10685 [Gammaproteobacteria bacterium]|nr:hypothetical protein [Gammaproteobacteria bacterium]